MAKILVIDDDRHILNYFYEALKKMGHEPVLARDGDEGCKLLESDSDIQMVFTDYCMPGKFQEISLVRKIRETHPGLPIVVISGYSDMEAVEECKALGVNDFLAKPFELSFVSSVVNSILGKSAGSAL